VERQKAELKRVLEVKLYIELLDFSKLVIIVLLINFFTLEFLFIPLICVLSPNNPNHPNLRVEGRAEG
jgi:hypothetical protein